MPKRTPTTLIGIARMTATVDLTGTVIGGSTDGPSVVKALGIPVGTEPLD